MTHFPLISFCSCFYFETKAYQTKRTPYHLSIIRLCTNPKTISSLSKSPRRQCRFRMEQLDIRFNWDPFPRKFLSLAVVRPVVSAYLRTITHAVAFAVRFSSFRWAFCAAWLWKISDAQTVVQNFEITSFSTQYDWIEWSCGSIFLDDLYIFDIHYLSLLSYLRNSFFFFHFVRIPCERLPKNNTVIFCDIFNSKWSGH